MAKDEKGHGSEDRSAAYRAGRRTKDELDNKAKAASAALQGFPKGGSMGLTPDHVKNSPEFQRAKAEYASAEARYKAHNQQFLKEHGAQYRADEADRRKAVAAGKQVLGRTIDLSGVRSTSKNKKYT